MQKTIDHENPLDSFDSEGREPILSVVRLSKRFGGLQAVRDLSFSVESGVVTALIGSNGAGKTTIFNLVTHYLAADSGSIRFRNTELTKLKTHEIARAGVGRTFQDLRLFKDLSCLDNILLGFRELLNPSTGWVLLRRRLMRECEERCCEKAMGILQFLNLEDKAQARAGSLGYADAKLITLGRILASEPRLIMLDEPCSGLDKSALSRVVSIIHSLIEKGHTVWLIEHNMAVVAEVAAHGIFLEHGSLVAKAPIAELLNDNALKQRYLGTQG